MRSEMWRVAAVAGISLSAVFTTACSGDGGGVRDSGSEPGASSSVSAEDTKARQADCMRKHGVDVEVNKDGGGLVLGDNSDLSEKKWAKIAEECGLDAGGGRAEMSQKDKDKMLNFARCMRDEGLDYPDPDLSSNVAGAPRIPPGQEETFAAASKKCATEAGF